ncbi:DNA repair protein RecN [Sphingomonas sp.]|jgi:DNA repair protein RecN (Recombination protein N)|uniref:DNA repair protein RecN n=1 Tax=Sphingomonas sp. TaxID=28214 RepID=UPI002D7FC2B2|nr:DNA repair protein RecN [Sphingomonas sp.]HEU0045942.1 DNA repair protein RecN [Sphingomonas sp.]
MLTALSIRDVVLIEALDLQFDAGLGVLTGETGAGKSILLDALGLTLGARGDTGLVRHGATQAVVTASFEASGEALAALLADSGLEVEPGEPLIVRRLVKADGGSRAFVNDQPASAALLRELGTHLVEVHGQHDDRGLLAPAGHRAMLDRFGRVDMRPTADAWQRLRAAEGALAAARGEIATAQADRDWLEHAVAELEALAPEPGEEETLADRRRGMQRAEKVADDLATVAKHLEGSDGGLARLRQAARVLERIAADHPALADALGAVDRAVIEGAAAEDQLREAARALEFDPRAQEADEARLFELRAMARKHRVQPDDLASLAEDLRGKVDRLDAGEEGMAALEAAVASARAEYAKAAAALTTARAEAGERLDMAVARELKPLKLDAAQFRTAISGLDEDGWSASGRDRVEFEISTNPGAPFAPLVKIASGGELSRFVLALKVALAERGGARTMVFDEVDRGVGGAVASAIGERLQRLAEGTQLLVVTHSPQVAARGAQHLLIAKSHDGTVTRTGVRALNEDERREEIARMLSGAAVTAEARAQADRLLEAA